MSSMYTRMLMNPHPAVEHPFETAVTPLDEISECASDQAEEIRRDLARLAREWSETLHAYVTERRRYALSTGEPDLRQLRERLQEVLTDEFYEVLSELDRLAEDPVF